MGLPAYLREDYNPLAGVKPSARVKMAIRLYATGACKTKKAASAAAGLHPNYLSMLTSTNGSDQVKRLLNDVDAMIEDKTVETSAIITMLGRKAIGRLAHMMDSASEGIALKAAVDLADRSPETAKTQKMQVESFSLSGQDAKELALAMVESARSESRYKHIAVEGLDEIGITGPSQELPAHAKEIEGSKSDREDAKQTIGPQV